MVYLVNKLIRKFKDTKWRYFLSKTHIRIVKGAKFKIGKNVEIINCNIYVDSASTLILSDEVKLENLDITIINGQINIGAYSFINTISGYQRGVYLINSGRLDVSDHSKLQSDRVWVRFSGVVKIGRYTNINYGSEIRSDESVIIGNYVQISYNVRIWDTNTHCIYDIEKREQLTRDKFPNFGYEYEKPNTSPVKIGNNCWIGEKSTILKGSKIGNNVIIGYNTMISGKKIPDNKKIIQEVNLRIL